MFEDQAREQVSYDQYPGKKIKRTENRVQKSGPNIGRDAVNKILSTAPGRNQIKKPTHSII